MLNGDNEINYVFLSSDITLTSGISIRPQKTSLIIDGLYPADGTGIIHTITDIDSTLSGDTIGIRAASNISVTMQNINFVGRNHYGIIYVPEGADYDNILITYKNLSYSGPQMTFHPNGLVRYIDCNINIIPSASCSAEEVGEVYQAEIGGNTIINHASTSYSVFWHRGSSSSPFLKILSGANVSITTSKDVVYTSYALQITVSSNSNLTVNTKYGMFRDSTHKAKSILFDTGSKVSIIQTNASESNSTINCQGIFTINSGSRVYIQNNYSGAAKLISFTTSAAQLIINNPKSVVLYSSSSKVFNFGSATNISVTGSQLNYWLTATELSNAGKLTDVPLYSWRKSNGSNAQITASATNLLTTVTSHNFTATELLNIPALILLRYHSASVLSIGDLSISLNDIYDDGSPITGTTDPYSNISLSYTIITTPFSLNATADAEGYFSVNVPSLIPINTLVTVSANTPFLITTVTRLSINLGKLEFKNVPDIIEFSTEAVLHNPTVLGRKIDDWTITVLDTRLFKTPWYIYSWMDKPLSTEDEKYSLPDAIVYLDKDENMYIIDETPTLIYEGVTESIITGITYVTWPANEGILLRVVSEPFQNGKQYKTNINWILTDHLL